MMAYSMSTAKRVNEEMKGGKGGNCQNKIKEVGEVKIGF